VSLRESACCDAGRTSFVSNLHVVQSDVSVVALITKITSQRGKNFVLPRDSTGVNVMWSVLIAVLVVTFKEVRTLGLSQVVCTEVYFQVSN
jgi:hypothetical protein